MNETLYAIQYNNNGTPQAIGTITEETYKDIYDSTVEQRTEANKYYNRLEKTLITDNHNVYKLARQLHRKSLQ